MPMDTRACVLCILSLPFWADPAQGMGTNAKSCTPRCQRTPGEGCLTTTVCVWKSQENLPMSSATHIGFSHSKMYFKRCLPKSTLATCLLLLAIVISYLLASTPCALCICSSLELCSADVRKHLRHSGLMSLFSHICFLYLTHGFSNTFIRHFFCVPTHRKFPWLTRLLEQFKIKY